jgi:uncharacterized protein (TIGR03382 family)
MEGGGARCPSRGCLDTLACPGCSAAAAAPLLTLLLLLLLLVFHLAQRQPPASNWRGTLYFSPFSLFPILGAAGFPAFFPILHRRRRKEKK